MTTAQQADPQRADESFRKTNSLAFANTECHTCLANGVACDRRRPKCRTCLSKGWQCGGFATPLSWDNSRIWLGQSVQQQRAPTRSQPDKTQSPRGQRRDEVNLDNQQSFTAPQQRGNQRQGGFRFVSSISRPRKRRKTANCDQSTRKRAHTIGEVDTTVSHAPNEDLSSRICHGDLETSTADTMMGAATSTTDLPEAAENAPLAGPDPPEEIVDDSLPEDTASLGLSGTDPSLMNQIIPSPSWDPEFLSHDLDNGSFSNPDDNWGICLDLLHSQQASTLDFNLNVGDRIQTSPFTMQQNLASGTMQVTAETADREYTWFFEKYDSEYCVLPITSDAVNNPFRLGMESLAASPLLEHAVRALCYQHMAQDMWQDRVLEHREKATRLLEDASSPESPPAVRGLSLLDSILLMITLDCTLSAFGKWNEHLHRAQVLLDAHGGPPGLTTSRLRSQVAMLLWWDVTLALISRHGMTLSRNYYDHLVGKESEDGWSFYDLTGCPGSLILYLLELADLAKQNEIAAMAKWLTMDLTPILQIEAEVKAWQNPFARSMDDNSPLTGDPEPAIFDSENEEIQSEENINDQQDQYHVVEAWRFAILVYVQRVFKWNRGKRPPSLLSVYARRALDHVGSCRRTAQTQKQALLPTFLAGSETRDGELREFASDYCKWWTARSRYNMFHTADTVLKEIWDAGADAWWGSIIDQNSGISGGKLERQYLFG